MTQDGIGYHEPNKRELLKIEDLTIGSGPLAAWGRKISAEVEPGCIQCRLCGSLRPVLGISFSV